MRRFQTLEEMNLRQSPNGRKIGIVPEGEIISGDGLAEKDGILWLQTEYEGRKGFVAVLPQEKNYAIELLEPEKRENPFFADVEALSEAYRALEEKIEKIRSIIKEF